MDAPHPIFGDKINFNQVREGYSVFLVRGTFPKPGSQFFQRLEETTGLQFCELQV